ncbi:hypothetical protein BGZ60DRAFT_384614 [Tricladium varicosporioides]|nr:hypothetical protein BGZ60DRAFT_384614 [Hymenoscyphus varicosporioides]
MSVEPLDFESLKDEERGLLNDTDLHILTLFESAISSSPEFNVDEKAKRFATDLVASAPDRQSGTDAESYVMSTWQVLICIASRISYRHYGQDVLVRIVGMLDAAGDMWKGLPGFGISMRDSWNHSPTFELDTEDDRAFTLDEWLNLNSFVARLFSTTVGRFINFAIWELRNGLEEDEHDVGTTSITDTRVLIASEWIVQSGRRLFRESLLNSLSTQPEDATHGSPYRGGSLYSGVKGFSLERWGFWKRRLTELRKDVSESIHVSINEAVEMMTQIEMEVANTYH